MVNKKRIQAAITQAEAKTTGEIHVHLCKHVHQKDTLTEAQQIFTQYHLENTPERNAILIFVALKSQRFAILGDTAIHEKLGQAFWVQVRDAMLVEFRQGHDTEALLAGIRLCGAYLQRHFPVTPDHKNNHQCDDVSEDDSTV